ncbi:MAG: membrane protein insertion efficiency factor YidD [Holosporaceae bacterium]|nr:membrane protein insertion efficiency factor YidD [Holosporaceae bacterium]
MRKFLILSIRAYQKTISPYLRPRCKFYPTCSEYAILAIKSRGVFIGVFKTIFRLLRCNPLSKGGVDWP